MHIFWEWITTLKMMRNESTREKKKLRFRVFWVNFHSSFLKCKFFVIASVTNVASERESKIIGGRRAHYLPRMRSTRIPIFTPANDNDGVVRYVNGKFFCRESRCRKVARILSRSALLRSDN